MVDPTDAAVGFEKGKLSFVLHGKKLCGEFHLVRTQRDPKSWLLIKSRDERADPDWKLQEVLPDDPGNDPGTPAPMPETAGPMLATSIDEPFDGDDWLFEVKWDGYRGICFLRGGTVRVESRGGVNLVDTFPDLASIRRAIDADTAVIDGEVVMLASDGKPDFQLLQNASGFRRTNTLRARTGKARSRMRRSTCFTSMDET